MLNKIRGPYRNLHHLPGRGEEHLRNEISADNSSSLKVISNYTLMHWAISLRPGTDLIVWRLWMKCYPLEHKTCFLFMYRSKHFSMCLLPCILYGVFIHGLMNSSLWFIALIKRLLLLNVNCSQLCHDIHVEWCSQWLECIIIIICIPLLVVICILQL